MSALGDLLEERTRASAAAVEHLHRLVAEWQLLADLSFADLVLWVPTGSGEFLCVAQVRPTTGPTAHREDLVGGTAGAEEHAALHRALADGGIHRVAEPRLLRGIRLRTEAVPIRLSGSTIAVLARDANLSVSRAPSPLEIAYLGSAADLCQMIADGTFPDSRAEPDVHTGPRAGDGVIRLDAAGEVVFASPNALSAYHRLGHAEDLLGVQLAPASRALVSDPLDAVELAERILAALDGRTSLRIEAETRGATVLLRALPLRPRGTPTGALVLVRDVTDLRRRDRALLSKDATIREIHHRVKNNLQTVAALLRLQARRTANPEARQALEDSERRVAAIALVHDTLSTSLDQYVDFDELVDKALPAITVVAVPGEPRATVRREGSFGVLPSEAATPLVLVLAELVQNAIEHAFAPGPPGEVVLRADRSPWRLDVVVADDGAGLPPEFDGEHTDRLGLRIVRTLVDSELRGTLQLRGRRPRGTEAVLQIPLSPTRR